MVAEVEGEEGSCGGFDALEPAADEDDEDEDDEEVVPILNRNVCGILA